MTPPLSGSNTHRIERLESDMSAVIKTLRSLNNDVAAGLQRFHKCCCNCCCGSGDPVLKQNKKKVTLIQVDSSGWRFNVHYDFGLIDTQVGINELKEMEFDEKEVILHIIRPEHVKTLLIRNVMDIMSDRDYHALKISSDGMTFRK